MTTISAEEQKQWEAYVALEPRLALLLGWVQEVRDEGRPGPALTLPDEER